MSKTKKQIALHVPLLLMQEIDKAAYSMRMSRTQFILRSLRRDLKAIACHEVARANQHSEAMEKEFGMW